MFIFLRRWPGFLGVGFLVAIRYLCEWQLLVAQAGCISVPFAFTCSREIPEIELCSFLSHMLGSRGGSALERAMLTLFHVCLAHPPAEAGFGLWRSMGWYFLLLWFLARCPQQAAEGSCSSAGRGREAAPEHWPSRALGLCKVSPILHGTGGGTSAVFEEREEKTEYSFDLSVLTGVTFKSP